MADASVPSPVPHLIVGGVRVAPLSRSDICSMVVADCNDRRRGSVPLRPARLLFSANGHTLSLAARDKGFRDALEQADVIHADGQAIVFASRGIRGGGIPERSATTDLIHDLAPICAAEGLSFFLLGGTEDVNARCAEALVRRYPGLKIAGRRNGYFRQRRGARRLRGDRCQRRRHPVGRSRQTPGAALLCPQPRRVAGGVGHHLRRDVQVRGRRLSPRPSAGCSPPGWSGCSGCSAAPGSCSGGTSPPIRTRCSCSRPGPAGGRRAACRPCRRRDQVDYLAVLKKRGWIVAVVAIVLTVAAVGVSFAIEPQYRASTRLLYQKSNLDLLVAGQAIFSGTNADREVQAGSLLVDAVADAVIKDLGLTVSREDLLDRIDSQGLHRHGHHRADGGERRRQADRGHRGHVRQGTHRLPDRFRAGEGGQRPSVWCRGRSTRSPRSDAASDYGAQLRAKLSGLQILRTRPVSGFRVLAPAIVPSAPFSPRIVLNGVRAFILGLHRRYRYRLPGPLPADEARAEGCN